MAFFALTTSKELIMFRLKLVDYFGESKVATDSVDAN